MDKQSNNNADLKSSIYDVADELGQLVLREHQILQGEMKQLSTLVCDAVKSLDSNFRHLNASAAEQTRIVDEVFSGSAADEEAHSKFSEISEQISQRTASTIRVLQFDDIVQQLAGHASSRIARMQELFNQLEAKLKRVGFKSDRVPNKLSWVLRSKFTKLMLEMSLQVGQLLG